MTDRELIEMAAKAAGYDISHPWNAERLQLGSPQIGLCIPGVSTLWNPLHDDGDALRLAVRLGMNVYASSGVIVAEIGHDGDYAPTVAKEPWKGMDGKLASTRRAIVRAAAELG